MTRETELDALLHHAGFATLDGRAFLRISGPDATRWLNGMVTNSIQALEPGQGSYNFLLNAQGRIQGDCHIYREPGQTASFLLATDEAQMATIQPLLDRFIIMDDVTLMPAYEGDESLLLAGLEAEIALAPFGITAPPPLAIREARTPDGEVLMLSEAEGGLPRLEFRASAAVIAAIRTAFAAAGLPEISSDALEHLRLLEGRPVYGKDIRDRDLPQEANQPHALHFNKGCYLGQEIVERIRSRGQVHRLLTRFELKGDLPSSFPVPLEADGKPAGEITSAAAVSLQGGAKLLALGYARREALDLKQPLSYPGGTAHPRS